MRKAVVGLVLLLFVDAAVLAQQGPWCATPSPAPKTRDWFAGFTRRPEITLPYKTRVPIPIVLHVLTDGKNGKLTPQQISMLIQNLNWAYRDAPFSFRLYQTETIKNASWFRSCVFNTTNQQKIRKRLAKDTRYYINVYSCRLGSSSASGISTFPPGYPIPGNPGATYMQGIAIDPITVGGHELFQRGLVLAHEVGHYLGLFHTFERYFNPDLLACFDPGDFVDDTPTQATPTFGSCPVGQDSCPTLPGADDIPNFMNYATDTCWDHFTPGQIERMAAALAEFRPALGFR
ncbi:MAG TPA: zinc metalloprotease [Thermoanaerobaculia bacterium]|jgi:hypothetical protein|nr:zinc metalloprotease [Thermoanaerobaculia bacterium]